MTSDNDERPTIMTLDGATPLGPLSEDGSSGSPFGPDEVPPPFPPLLAGEQSASVSPPPASDDPFAIAPVMMAQTPFPESAEVALDPLPVAAPVTPFADESPTGGSGLTPPPIPADVPPAVLPPPLPEPATEPAVVPPPVAALPPPMPAPSRPERTAKFAVSDLAGEQRSPEASDSTVAAWIYFRTGERRGEIYQFRRERSEIGRAPDCDLRLEDDYASSRHGAVIFDGAGWRLFDFASTNGTAVNGLLLGSQTPIPFGLNDGDVIVIGDTEMVFKCVN